MNSVLFTLGLARKAGAVEVGEEPVGAAARSRHARVIFTASDAADNTIRRAENFARAGNTVVIKTPMSKADIGSVVGKTECAVIAISDPGFAYLLVSKLAQAEPEKYADYVEAFKSKAERYEQRKREKRAHEKNKRFGKKH